MSQVYTIQFLFISIRQAWELHLNWVGFKQLNGKRKLWTSMNFCLANQKSVTKQQIEQESLNIEWKLIEDFPWIVFALCVKCLLTLSISVWPIYTNVYTRMLVTNKYSGNTIELSTHNFKSVCVRMRVRVRVYHKNECANRKATRIRKANWVSKTTGWPPELEHPNLPKNNKTHWTLQCEKSLYGLSVIVGGKVTFNEDDGTALVDILLA